MKNRMKLTTVQKYEKLARKLTNATLVKSLIQRYQTDTKNAVQNIVNMCKTVKELHDKVKTGELTENDLNYFCATVSLDKTSSTFRKYLCIADKAALFERYLDRVPASYTVLYEITTLDSEQFEMLLSSKQLNNFITLKEVKTITGKSNVHSKNTQTVELSVKFDKHKISKDSLKIIAECYKYMKVLSDAEIITSNSKLFEDALILNAA